MMSAENRKSTLGKVAQTYMAYALFGVLSSLLLIYAEPANSELNLTNIFGQTTKEDEEAIARIAGPKIQANAHLYAIFCESGNHPARKTACEGLFARIINDLWGRGVNHGNLENVVRAYKRVYDIID